MIEMLGNGILVNFEKLQIEIRSIKNNQPLSNIGVRSTNPHATES